MAAFGAARRGRGESTNTADIGVADVVLQAHTISGDVHLYSNGRGIIAPPRQLPAAPRHFTGRDEELAALDGHAGNASVVVLTGPAGVGKSALALAWLHHLRDAYPDGQLFGDLQGHTPDQNTSPDQVLGHFLRALGVEPRMVPAEHAERVGLFRSMTTDRRLLIMLDNVVSPADVLPLVPGPPHALVVVTSRHRMPGLVARGARTVEVRPLSDEAGLQLVTGVVGERRVGAEASASAELVQACAGLPLALWLVSAQLVSRPLRGVGDLVDDLRTDRTALDSFTADDLSLRAALDLSYGILDPVAARAFRLVVNYPGPDFTSGVAAAASEVPTREDAVRALGVLVDVHLVEELDADRYRLHDLVRLYAGDRAVVHDGRAALDDAELRMAEWYLTAALAADRVVVPSRRRLGGPEHHSSFVPTAATAEEALDWIEPLLPHFLAVIHANAHHRLGYQIVEALWSLFLHRKHYPQWLETHDLVLATASSSGDTLAETLLLNHLGLGLHGVGRFTEAGDVFLRALRAHRRTGDRVGEATALNSLGLVLYAVGRLPEALEHFEGALALQVELGQSRGEALTRFNLARAVIASGGDALVRPHLSRARTEFRSITDDYNGARVDVELAALAVREGDREQARELLGASLAVMAPLGADVELVAIHRMLASLAHDVAAAREHLAEAERHEERLTTWTRHRTNG
jgi:tetratricopeptide (TPR) repeat protein